MGPVQNTSYLSMLLSVARQVAKPLWGTASELAFYGIENMDCPASKMKTQNRELSINQELEFQIGELKF